MIKLNYFNFTLSIANKKFLCFFLELQMGRNIIQIFNIKIIFRWFEIKNLNLAVVTTWDKKVMLFWIM